MHENNQLRAHGAACAHPQLPRLALAQVFSPAPSRVILAVVTMMLPSAYTVEGPGPTQDVLGSSSGSDVDQHLRR